MRIISTVALACLTLSLASCGSSSAKSQDLIVGKWEGAEGKSKGSIFEYTKDGKAKMKSAGVPMEATYKFLDDNTMELQMQTMDGQKVPDSPESKTKFKVAVTQDQLTLTDDKGKAEKFKRVK